MSTATEVGAAAPFRILETTPLLRDEASEEGASSAIASRTSEAFESHKPDGENSPLLSRDTEIQIKRYQVLQARFRIVKIVGVVVTIAALAATALFFTPGSIALLIIGIGVGAAVLINRIKTRRTNLRDLATMSCYVTAPLAVVGAVGLIVPTYEFVYQAKVAAIAGIAGGALTAVGGILIGVGAVGEYYCQRKISQLRAQMPFSTLQHPAALRHM